MSEVIVIPAEKQEAFGRGEVVQWVVPIPEIEQHGQPDHVDLDVGSWYISYADESMELELPVPTGERVPVGTETPVGTANVQGSIPPLLMPPSMARTHAKVSVKVKPIDDLPYGDLGFSGGGENPFWSMEQLNRWIESTIPFVNEFMGTEDWDFMDHVWLVTAEKVEP